MNETCTDCGKPAELMTLGGDQLCRSCNIHRHAGAHHCFAELGGEAAIRALNMGYGNLAELYAKEAAHQAHIAYRALAGDELMTFEQKVAEEARWLSESL